MTIVICDDILKDDSLLVGELQKDVRKKTVIIPETKMCVDYLKNKRTEILFLSVCSKSIDYMAVLEAVRNMELETVVCLVGETEEQSVLAYRYKCDYYLQKPLDDNDITKCIRTLELLSKRIKTLRAVTFGNFELFVNDTPVVFRNAKAKELLALCVDRQGGKVSIYEATDLLWPDKEYDEKAKRLYRKAVMSIHNTLEEYGISDFFFSVRGGCKIDSSKLNCDFYSFMCSPKEELKYFSGKYMSEYSWGEETLAKLIRLAEHAADGKVLEYLY